MNLLLHVYYTILGSDLVKLSMIERLFDTQRLGEPAKLGVLATYLLSSLLLALGVAYALWIDIAPLEIWAWTVIIAISVAIETYVLMRATFSSAVELAACAVVSLLWGTPIFLWFVEVSPDTKLLLVIFSFLIALCATLLKRNGPVRTPCSVGVALPIAFVILWQLNHQSVTYASVAVLSGWFCLLCLGWLIGWSSDQRRLLLNERQLLLERLEAKMTELDQARADEHHARAIADQASQDKSKFLAMISHDLRQPIYAANLMFETAKHSEQETLSTEQLTEVQGTLNDLTRYLETLLDTAMLDSGSMTVKQAEFELAALSQQLEAEYRDTAKQHNMSVSVELPPTWVETDQVLLSRVMRNLISNAIYHSGGTSVSVTHVQDGEGVYVRVSDDGVGMPDHVQALFDVAGEHSDAPADKIDSDRRGLGLSIVRRLSDLLRVEIRLQTSRHGTRFEVGPFIPLPTPTRARNAQETRNLNAEKTIVLVDDDSVILERLTDLLTRWGYCVHASARLLPEIPKADLIIADLDLGDGTDGVDVIRYARSRWGETVPAFIITGNTSREIADRIQSAGLRAVYKPVHPAALKSIILTELTQTDLGGDDG